MAFRYAYDRIDDRQSAQAMYHNLMGQPQSGARGLHIANGQVRFN